MANQSKSNVRIRSGFLRSKIIADTDEKMQPLTVDTKE